jgi:hypothetical protein
MMSWPRRSAYAITPIATIFPLVILNVITATRICWRSAQSARASVASSTRLI